YTSDALQAVGATATSTIIPTDTPAAQICIFTAAVDLNCRSGPGAAMYPVVDFISAGQSVAVIGQSPDGNFFYVVGPQNVLTCAVPSAESYGMTAGDCGLLTVFTPLPPVLPEMDPTSVPVNCSGLDQGTCNITPGCQWYDSATGAGAGYCGIQP
ncbi:MAG: hypothetical protein JW862_05410, partial [Anaerolineales bacterium]|nr:hypothetical protein [Anaerolineales bacterium]